MGSLFFFHLFFISLWDVKTQRIPDRLNLSLALWGLLNDTRYLVWAALIFLVGWAVQRLSAEKIGLGDIKLVGALAVWLGAGALQALVWAFFLAAGWALGGILLLRWTSRRTLPFGPFICLGATLVIWGISVF